MAAIPARVLLVDDDAGIRDLMAMLLATVGYEVSTAKLLRCAPRDEQKKTRL
jgi:DNA-binding NtrC family response regulator